MPFFFNHTQEHEAMLCNSCGNDKSRVLKTYADADTGDIIRVRECVLCGHVWRTVESYMFPCEEPPAKVAIVNAP